ncbi:MAG: hypothetical protein AAF203_02375 [Pseudomonadota bacterium]
MRRFLSPLLIILTVVLSNCTSDNNNSVEGLALNMGKPGETKVENNLPQRDEVKVLTEKEKIQFISEDGTATITNSDDLDLEVGDVIIANPEQKFLVKVKKVTPQVDGSLQYQLGQAHIEDIVGDESGSLKIESTPIFGTEEIGKLNEQAKDNESESFFNIDDNGKITIRNLEVFNVNLGKKGRIHPGNNKIMGIQFNNPSDRLRVRSGVEGQFKATINEATIEILPTIRSEADWSWGKLSTLQTRLDTRVRYHMDVTYELAGEIHSEALFDLMPRKTIPVRIPGTPPVYLDIELAIPLGVSLKADRGGKTRVVFEADYEIQSSMDYNRITGVTTDKKETVNVKQKKVLSDTAASKIDAELFLKPMITARFYRVVGPHVYLKPYIRGEFEFPAREKKDDLFVGMGGGLGLEISEPIFLKTIANFDSGNLFDWFESYDIDGAGNQPVKSIPLKIGADEVVTIDKIGPEGFVELKLKSGDEDRNLRFELVKTPQTGLLIPADDYAISGKLYYYPLKNSETESFIVKIYGPNGTATDHEVQINIDANVIAEVSKDRFGTTTNSYKVATGTPGQFADGVPKYDLGGVTATVHVENPAPETEINGSFFQAVTVSRVNDGRSIELEIDTSLFRNAQLEDWAMLEISQQEGIDGKIRFRIDSSFLLAEMEGNVERFLELSPFVLMPGHMFNRVQTGTLIFDTHEIIRANSELMRAYADTPIYVISVEHTTFSSLPAVNDNRGSRTPSELSEGDTEGESEIVRSREIRLQAFEFEIKKSTVREFLQSGSIQTDSDDM